MLVRTQPQPNKFMEKIKSPATNEYMIKAHAAKKYTDTYEKLPYWTLALIAGKVIDKQSVLKKKPLNKFMSRSDMGLD